MTLIEFLMQYQDTLEEIEQAKERLAEMYFPERGNRIVRGEHSGISNLPEEYTIIKEKLETKIERLTALSARQKKRIEAFLRRLKPRHAKILRRKYIEGLNNHEMAAWMHIQVKSAISALRIATDEAEKEYKIFCEQKKTPE